MQTKGLNILLLAFVGSCMLRSNAKTQGIDEHKLPDFIAPCYRDDPMLSECIKSSMYRVIRKLVHGIPELDVPPIEPLYKDEIEAFDVAGFRLKLLNITIRGASTINITWNSASIETKIYEFAGEIGPLEIDATYELTGFIIPINATGSVNAIGRHFGYRVKGMVDKANEDGFDYVKISDLRVNIFFKDGALWISNLGPLEVVINQLLNLSVNIRFIMNHLTPIVEEVLTNVLQKFINRIYNTVPYDALLPEGSGPVPASTVEPHNDDDAFLGYKKKAFLGKIMDILY